MELSYLLLQQILGMVLMALLGFAAGKTGIIKGQQSRVLSCLTLYIMTPCNLIVSFSSKRDLERLEGLFFSLIAALILRSLFVWLSDFVNRKKRRITQVEQASVIYNNVGNMTIPLVQSVLGMEYVLYTSPHFLIQTLYMWTHGQKLMGGVQKLTLKRLLKTPAIAGTLIGLFFFFTGLPIPGLIYSSLERVGGSMLPVVMIEIGILLSEVDLKQLVRMKRVYFVCAIRLVLLPLLAMAILLAISRVWNHSDAVNILVVALLCYIGPSAATVTQQAQLYCRENAGYASSINVLTTMMCAITMPLMTTLFLMFV